MDFHFDAYQTTPKRMPKLQYVLCPTCGKSILATEKILKEGTIEHIDDYNHLPRGWVTEGQGWCKTKLKRPKQG